MYYSTSAVFILARHFCQDPFLSILVLTHFSLCLCVWQLVAAFTNSTVKLEARKGGLFSLLDGLISGEYMELVSSSIEIASVHHLPWLSYLWLSYVWLYASKYTTSYSYNSNGLQLY